MYNSSNMSNIVLNDVNYYGNRVDNMPLMQNHTLIFGLPHIFDFYAHFESSSLCFAHGFIDIKRSLINDNIIWNGCDRPIKDLSKVHFLCDTDILYCPDGQIKIYPKDIDEEITVAISAYYFDGCVWSHCNAFIKDTCVMIKESETNQYVPFSNCYVARELSKNGYKYNVELVPFSECPHYAHCITDKPDNYTDIVNVVSNVQRFINTAQSIQESIDKCVDMLITNPSESIDVMCDPSVIVKMPTYLIPMFYISC